MNLPWRPGLNCKYAGGETGDPSQIGIDDRA